MLNFATRLSADRYQLFWASVVNRLKEVLLIKCVLKQGYPVDICGTGVTFPKDAFLLRNATADRDPPILLSNAYRGLFPLGVRWLWPDVQPSSASVAEVIRGAVPPLPYMSLWCGALNKYTERKFRNKITI